MIVRLLVVKRCPAEFRREAARIEVIQFYAARKTVVTIRKLRSIVLPAVRSRLNGAKARSERRNKIFAFPLPALASRIIKKSHSSSAPLPWKIKRVLPIVFDPRDFSDERNGPTIRWTRETIAQLFLRAIVSPPSVSVSSFARHEVVITIAPQNDI